MQVAVKANKKLDEIEIKAILDKLNMLQNPYTCPHGRPTVVKITNMNLKKCLKNSLICLEDEVDNVLVIIGPTASGKTKLAIEIAKRANGEIISADSMQIYKYMDIGTAKPDEEEKEGIKHYLIDEVTPDEEFSVARFKELALNILTKF